MAKRITKTKFVPCSCAQGEKFAQWLKDMAADGYILNSYNANAMFAKFDIKEAENTDYIVAPKPYKAVYDEYRDILLEYRYEKCETYGNYEIFKAATPSEANIRHNKRFGEIIELNTIRESKRSVIGHAILLAFCLLLLSCFSFTVRFGIPLTAVIICEVFSSFFSLIKSARKITSLKSSDNSADVPDWQSGRKKHIAKEFAKLTVLVILLIFLEVGEETFEKEYRLNIDPPFATAADCESEAYTVYRGNSYTTQISPIAPVNYFWDESGKRVADDGSTQLFRLDISYYEACSVAAAKKICSEHKILNIVKSVFKVWQQSRYSFDNTDFDYYEAFFYKHNKTSVLIRNGNRVMNLEYTSYDNSPIPQEWLKTISEHMK